MTSAIIITFCLLFLLAYVFDFSAEKTRVPAVILLLLLGWLTKQATAFSGLALPDMSAVLPILGTIGLILIVLEGSLELELNRSKLTLIRKSLLGALIALLLLAAAIAAVLYYFTGRSISDCLLNAVPFCVISSAMAIPSARGLTGANKEFVTYESSLSDIFGVLLFNFVALNKTIGASAFGTFSLQVILVLVVSFLATLALAFLLNRITHRVKFVPILLLVILIYDVSKIYNLPALVFILLFGLFLGNLDELKRFSFIRRLNPDALNLEVHKFKDLLAEVTFLIRSLFFIVFGYLIEASEVFNVSTFLWALWIVALVLLVRKGQLALSKLPQRPLLYVAPRGLITILLFLSIAPERLLPLVNRPLIVQVIVLSALVMMVGLMLRPKEQLQ